MHRFMWFPFYIERVFCFFMYINTILLYFAIEIEIFKKKQNLEREFLFAF